MIIVVDNISHIVGMAGAEGSDVTGANWCDKYTLAGFTAVSGVTLPPGYLNNCFTYISGVFAIVAGKEALVAAQILRGTTAPTLSAGDISLGGSTLSDGVTQVSLEVLVHPVAESTSYELRYTSTKDGIYEDDIYEEDIYSNEVYSYITVLEPGLVNIAGLKANTDYSIALRAYGMYGVSDWTADVIKTTDNHLTDSLLSELTSDNKFTAVEKSQLKPQYDSLVAEQATILSAVTNMAVTAISDLYTTYAGHLATLTAYVASTGLFTDMYVTTDISGATLKTALQNVLTSKSNLNTAMASYYGRDGVDGYNSAIVYLYQRKTSVPSNPSGTVTYTFSTGAKTGLTNDWLATIPAGTDPLYIIGATAISRTDTDTIGTGEWSSPTIITAEPGIDGAPGINSATVYLFQRTGTSTPPDTPASSLSYTFADGAIAESLGSWSRTMPASGGSYRWMTTATAISTASTDTILSSEWATSAMIARDGVDGVDSIRVLLSNQFHPLPALNDGTVTDYSGATCTATVYNGTAADDSWTCVQTRSAGLTVTEATSSKTATVTGLTTAYDSATITFALSKDGYSDIVATFSLAKSKGGAVGAVGPALLLTSSKQAFTATDDVLDEGIYEDDIYEDDIYNVDQPDITFVATLSGLTGGVTWSSSPAVTLGGAGLTRTLTLTDFGLNDQVTITATSADNPDIFDVVTVVRLSTRFTAEPYATVGAPTGTVIHDRTAEQVVADTAAAAETANYPSISNIPNNILRAGQSETISLLNTDITITNTGGVITLSGAGGGSVNVDEIIVNKVTVGFVEALHISASSITTGELSADLISIGTGDAYGGSGYLRCFGSYHGILSTDIATINLQMDWRSSGLHFTNDVGINLLGVMSGSGSAHLVEGALIVATVVPADQYSKCYPAIFEVDDFVHKTGAPLVIVPSKAAGAPTHSARPGSFWPSVNGNLYFNSVGTWRQIAFV